MHHRTAHLYAHSSCWLCNERNKPHPFTAAAAAQIADPEGEMLLRLSADRLETAKAWVRALQAAGLYVQHLQRFTMHHGLGFGSAFETAQMASHRSAPHLSGEWLAGDPIQQQQQQRGGLGVAAVAAATGDEDLGGGLGLRQRLLSLGRVLSFRPQSPANSMDSDISVMRVRQQHIAAKPPPRPAAAAAAGKKAAATANDSAVGAATGPKVELRRPATYHGGESVSDVQQQEQQQQQGLQGGPGSSSLQHLRRMLLRTQSSRRCVWCGVVQLIGSSVSAVQKKQLLYKWHAHLHILRVA
jgi:hypothetical protein